MFYYSALICSLMFVLSGSVPYSSVDILIIQSTIGPLSLSRCLCIVSLPATESRDIHLHLRGTCHFLSRQQWEVVGVSWGRSCGRYLRLLHFITLSRFDKLSRNVQLLISASRQICLILCHGMSCTEIH